MTNLTDSDRESLSRSFITAELAELAQLRRVDDLEGAQIVGRTPKGGTSYAGIVYPYFDPPIFSNIREYALRRDEGDYEPNEKGEIKEKKRYLYLPGKSNMLYFPPGITKNDLERTDVPCVITEGQKKTLALYRLATEGASDIRFLPIGLAGVWNWRGTIGKTDGQRGSRKAIKGTIRDFDWITWKGREVRILFDADVRSNETVQAARTGLAWDLAKRGSVVRFAELPNGWKIDDLLGHVESESGTEAAIREGLRILDSAVAANNLKALRTVRLSDVEAKPVDWLWEPFLARGAFSIVDGVEGIGKTFLLLKIAVAVTQGRGLPGVNESDHVKPSNVLLVSAEDSLAFVIKPRLEALGAPCDRIIAVEEAFTLDSEGMYRLSLALAQHEPALLIIDPLFSRVGGLDLNKDSDIRSVTDALNRLAEDHNCAIVGIRHINKSKGFGDARNAGLNGVGWRAGSRSALLVGVNPNNHEEKAICQTKNNLAPVHQGSLGFRITLDGVCEWTGKSNLTAEMMLAFKESVSIEERSARKDATTFLKDQLSAGPRKAVDIQIEARNAGISESTLRRAKDDLGIKPHKSDFGGQWTWELPANEDVHEDVQTTSRERLREGCSRNPNDYTTLAEGAHEDDQSCQGARRDSLKAEGEHLRVNAAKASTYSPETTEGVQASDTERLRDNLRQAGGKAYDKCQCGGYAFIGQKCPHCNVMMTSGS